MEYSSLTYDPTHKEPLLKAFPDLADYEEFHGSDAKLRFVIALLNEDDKETDLERRVAKAAKIAKIKNTEGILEDNEVERMMCRYFIILNKDTFELWLSKKIGLGEANHQIRSSVVGYKDPIKAMEIKLKVGQGAEILRKDILQLERQLFRDAVVEKKIKASVSNRVIHYAELHAESDTVE